jgi:ABC-type lipoprotein export system ATPase subunit
MALIREPTRQRATIVMITHDAGLADQLPRQVRVLDGQVISKPAAMLDQRRQWTARGRRTSAKSGR